MDRALTTSLHGFIGKFPLFDSAAALLGSVFPYIVVVAVVVVFFMRAGDCGSSPFARRKWLLGRFFTIVIGLLVTLGIVIPAIQLTYTPARPFAVFGWKPLIAMSAAEPSFPSGHATVFFFLAVLVWQSDRRRGVWFFAVAAVIAFARVYAGVHWPSDVLFGALLGVFVGALLGKYISPFRAVGVPEV